MQFMIVFILIMILQELMEMLRAKVSPLAVIAIYVAALAVICVTWG